MPTSRPISLSNGSNIVLSLENMATLIIVSSILLEMIFNYQCERETFLPQLKLTAELLQVFNCFFIFLYANTMLFFTATLQVYLEKQFFLK